MDTAEKVKDGPKTQEEFDMCGSCPDCHYSFELGLVR